jgi:molecular chaperone DnaK (HSP70)
MFGKDPNISVDPDMAIAKGASIHAANLLKSGGALEYAD